MTLLVYWDLTALIVFHLPERRRRAMSRRRSKRSGNMDSQTTNTGGAKSLYIARPINILPP